MTRHEEIIKTFRIDKEVYTLVKLTNTITQGYHFKINTPPNSFGYIDVMTLHYDIFRKPYITSQRYHKPKVLKRCKNELLKVQALQ